MNANWPPQMVKCMCDQCHPGKWSATIVISSLALERFNSKAVVNPMTPAPNTTTSAIEINWNCCYQKCRGERKTYKNK